MLKIDFVIENNKLFITEIGIGKRTARAALEIACSIAEEYGLDEKLVVPPGSKIQLINQTVNADEHLNKWVLQLQENYMGDGRIVEGATSTLVNPSCYLYNLGQHKIKLTTTSKNGCNETVLAENIYVEGAQGRAIQSYFETEDSYQLGNL